MRCPFCSSEDTQVKDSRPAEEGAAIRRRRQCGECGGRFTTFERVQLRELTIVKSSGKKVPFDREKLHRSIAIATRKRDIDAEQLERTVSTIIRQLEASGENEISSRDVGEYVMRALKDIDAVAFVRYASVYRNFTQAKDFEAFLDSMEQE
ncbi:transcriptional regulator NrdR [Parvularcula sp. LCG005]|uniref:transcriptional regulator NrdR n=1 Tax=Parvularcula sp. LCG005 TaxID=3078805 RepID=UPI002943159F|nr:transcriptional regulator NrdR [Parvularcula sp. LCG005]WOI52424.1 transcriptional regulator NrdR [Parvularcula sp. LCG005]